MIHLKTDCKGRIDLKLKLKLETEGCAIITQVSLLDLALAHSTTNTSSI